MPWSRFRQKRTGQEYQPNDITAEVKMETVIMNMKLAKGANLKSFLDKMTALESQS